MRRLNAIVLLALFVAFIAHAAMGVAETLAGEYMPYVKVTAHIAFILVLVHAVLSLIVFVRAKIGAHPWRYFGKNSGMWLRFITGILFLAFLVIHGMSFFIDDVPVAWSVVRFAVMTAFVVLLLIHVASGIEPFCIALGIPLAKGVKVGTWIVALAGAALCVYTFYTWWGMITAMLAAAAVGA